MADKKKGLKTKVVPVVDEARKKALEEAMAGIEKQFGKGSLMKLGDRPNIECDVVPTGIMSVDFALGIGGLPKGRIIEIYGAESSGKTTLALHAVAEAQKAGGVAAFIDAEHALDSRYAKRLGVNINELLISQPDYGEEALEIVEALVRSGAVDIIIVDSVAALVPKAEINGDMGETQVGIQARLMSLALRKLAGIIAKSNTVVVFLNQLRQKVSMTYGGSNGPSETTTGGRALKFYASVRIEVKKIESLKASDNHYGNKTKIKIVKNKMAPPFKEATFDIIFGTGASKETSLLDIAVQHDIIKKSGAWFSYNDEKIGQGREKVRIYLKENPEFYKEVESKVYQYLKEHPQDDFMDGDETKEDFSIDEENIDIPNFEEDDDNPSISDLLNL